MNAAYRITGNDLAHALGEASRPRPQFLRDVLAIKQERGDEDCDDFKLICKEFGSGQFATVSGAAYAMRQWVANPLPCQRKQAMREAFLADLEAFL